MQLSIANIHNCFMNKTFLQWFFWIAIKFLRTAHVKASRLISHLMIQSKTFPVSHITLYPPGSCHAAVMSGCDAVMWSWHGGAGNMKCCCAENENVHIVEIVCTLHGLGEGNCKCTIDSGSLSFTQLSVLEYYLVTDRSQICGHYNLGDWKKVIREWLRV